MIAYPFYLIYSTFSLFDHDYKSIKFEWLEFFICVDRREFQVEQSCDYSHILFLLVLPAPHSLTSAKLSLSNRTDETYVSSVHWSLSPPVGLEILHHAPTRSHCLDCIATDTGLTYAMQDIPDIDRCEDEPTVTHLLIIIIIYFYKTLISCWQHLSALDNYMYWQTKKLQFFRCCTSDLDFPDDFVFISLGASLTQSYLTSSVLRLSTPCSHLVSHKVIFL